MLEIIIGAFTSSSDDTKLSEGIRTLAMSSPMKFVDYIYRIWLSCLAELVDEAENHAQLIVLLVNATVSDLEIEAANSFPVIYLMLRKIPS
ncbi:unnamed protein product [Lupinus luteus]|uniref:Uncharacterized protein n=1 Tax=Lupinus luteus TaxID=3873 RepID=A0AAV1Y576_LUPLU